MVAEEELPTLPALVTTIHNSSVKKYGLCTVNCSLKSKFNLIEIAQKLEHVKPPLPPEQPQRLYSQ
jgi:hypothetical protein